MRRPSPRSVPFLVTPRIGARIACGAGNSPRWAYARGMRNAAAFALVIALGTGCAHKQLTNRQVAIGIGVAAIVVIIIYAASQSHCLDNSCNL
jgi:hypothetical protein